MTSEYDTPRYLLTRSAETLVELARNVADVYKYLFMAVQAGADEYDIDGNLSEAQTCLNKIYSENFAAMLWVAKVLSDCPAWKPEESKEGEDAEVS